MATDVTSASRRGWFAVLCAAHPMWVMVCHRSVLSVCARLRLPNAASLTADRSRLGGRDAGASWRRASRSGSLTGCQQPQEIHLPTVGRLSLAPDLLPAANSAVVRRLSLGITGGRCCVGRRRLCAWPVASAGPVAFLAARALMLAVVPSHLAAPTALGFPIVHAR